MTGFGSDSDRIFGVAVTGFWRSMTLTGFWKSMTLTGFKK